MTRRATDVEVDALAGAVIRGITYLDEHRHLHSDTSFDVLLRGLADRAIDAIEHGVIEHAVHDMTIGTLDGLGTALAALAMRPGGFRVLGVVFCARHAPYGSDASFRYACRDCDPCSFRDLALGVDLRDVVTIEGIML